MSGTAYVSLSLANQLERSLNMSAHNIANANTAGFKSLHPLLESSPHESGGNSVDFVSDGGSYLDLTTGAMVPTGNPLDMAIAGDGWFGVKVEGGETGYTRHGKFIMDAQGMLKTSHGHTLLGADNAPITLPLEIGLDITVMKDGTIATADGEALGRVGVFQIESDDRMTSLGGGIYVPAGGEPAAPIEEGVEIAQGFVEGSNVQAVLEMTRLIDIQRAYENAMRITGEDNDLTKEAIQRLGRNS